MDQGRRSTLRLLGLAGMCGPFAGCLSGDNSGDDGSGEFQHVDEPPYEITEPDCPQSGEERDPLWLCANMAAEPSVQFEQVETSGTILQEEGLRFDTDTTGMQFYTTLLRDSDDLDRLDSSRGGPAIELIDQTSFDAAMILIAQTGWGSGTVTPHIKRVESTAEGIHAFGCYRRPCGGTDDVTQRTVVVRFQRMDTLELATVSLTVDATTRVNFRSSDGIITVDGSANSALL